MDIRIIDIINIIESIAPPALAEDWDNVGLLVGSQNAAVKKIMVTLDVTSRVVDEARENNVDLIVSHHPVIFTSMKSITDDGNGKLLLSLIESGIAVYSAHTNFDKAQGGMDDTLSSVLGLTNVKPLTGALTDYDRGFGRIGELNEEVLLSEYLKRLYDKLHVEVIDIIGDKDKTIKKVASCAGAGGEFIIDAKKAGADVFITGEIKYHEAINGLDMDMGVVALGHHTSEYPGVSVLKSCLQNAVDKLQYNVDVILSNSQFSIYNRQFRG